MPSLTIDTTVDIDVEVWCATCGGGLCGQSTVENSCHGVATRVAVCETCLERARADAYNEGYEQGRTDEANAIGRN